jgi:hypothetical protein
MLEKWNTEQVSNYEMRRINDAHGALTQLWKRGFPEKAATAYSLVTSFLKLPYGHRWLLPAIAKLEGAALETNRKCASSRLDAAIEELNKTLASVLKCQQKTTSCQEKTLTLCQQNRTVSK